MAAIFCGFSRTKDGSSLYFAGIERGTGREDGVETESELTHAAAQGDGETQTDNASKYLSRARNFRSSPNADFVHVG